MDTAYCTIDKQIHEIFSFEKLDGPTRERLRGNLLCPKCKQVATFCRKSRDGKSPYFRAHHIVGCENSTQDSSSQSRKAYDKEVRRLKADTQVIHLTWGGNNPSNTQSSGNPNSRATSSSDTAKRHTQEPAQKTKVRRNLQKLLNLLLETEDSDESVRFASSEIEIDTGGQYPFKAKDLFVRFDAISQNHMKRWQGYWGVIKGVGTGKNSTTWLNTQTRDGRHVGIPVEGLEEENVKVGSFALVFGTLRESKKTGAWYLANVSSGKYCIKRSKTKR